jgi:hypothetical protein
MEVILGALGYSRPFEAQLASFAFISAQFRLWPIYMASHGLESTFGATLYSTEWLSDFWPKMGVNIAPHALIHYF